MRVESRIIFNAIPKKNQSQEIKEWRKQIDTFITFCSINLPQEAFVMAVVTMVREYKFPVDMATMPALADFVKVYRSVLLD